MVMPNKKTQKLFAFAILFFISVLLTSCGVWTDFTTYFNTYYNARTLFDQTEEAILKQNKDPFIFREDEQRNIPGYNTGANQQRQTTNFNPTANIGNTRTQAGGKTQFNQDLTKVIEKCSKILQFEKESSYFDDALFMTGKAFYYQGEYARAQRKFLELAALPESDYALENKLWLAKTYLQLRSFDDGLKLIEEVKTEAQKEDEPELFSSASITKIGFYVYREEYTNAINECQSFLKNLDDDEMTALVWYQMGKIYLQQGDEENALKAFSSVLNYSPTFDVEFESRLQHALLLKDLKRLDESENELNNLLEGGKFKTQTDRIMVELGDIYYDKGNSEKAVQTFKEIDSTYKNTQASGMASFMLGKIYERQFGIYDSAYKYYTKTASSLAPYQTKIDAASNVKNIDKYFTLKKTINGYEKGFLYLTNSTRYMQDSIDYDLAYKEYMDEVKVKVDSMVAQAEMNQIVSANQKNVYQQQVQNLMQQSALKRIASRRTQYTPTLKDLIVQGKVSKPEIPKLKADTLKIILSKNYYDLGNLFFSELEVPDSAYFYYQKILNDYPASPSTPAVLFALGAYYETKNQKEKADSLYQIIYDNYKKDPLFSEAGIKLGLIKKEEKKLTNSNSDPAEEEYIAAEKKYYDKKYREAINGLTKVYLNYPRSAFLPKALYFIGLIYEENFQKYDSAAVYYAILSSKEYASTPYGKAVAAKYMEYKKEKERIEAEKKKQQEEENKKLQDQQKLLKPIVEAKDSSAAKSGTIDKKENNKTIENTPAKKDSTLSVEERRKELFKEKMNVEKPDTSKKILKDESTKKDTIKSIEERRKELFRDEKIQALPDSSKNKAAEIKAGKDSSNVVNKRKELLNEEMKKESPDSTKKIQKIE